MQMLIRAYHVGQHQQQQVSHLQAPNTAVQEINQDSVLQPETQPLQEPHSINIPSLRSIWLIVRYGCNRNLNV